MNGIGVRKSLMPVLFSWVEMYEFPFQPEATRRVYITHYIYFSPLFSNHCLKSELSPFHSDA